VSREILLWGSLFGTGAIITPVRDKTTLGVALHIVGEFGLDKTPVFSYSWQWAGTETVVCMRDS